MSDDARLSELLLRWQEERDQGREITPTELCADSPELADELKLRIEALQSMEAKLKHETVSGLRQGQNETQDYVARGAATAGRGPMAPPGYELLGELGRGGMGVVYKARQVKLNRIVALKMILARGHAGPEELQRFRMEAEAVARLQHPGIVQIHDIGEHDGLPYFSLEYVEGGNLDRKLRGNPLPAQAAARLTSLVAMAMQAAHERGILHRDLKPANIFLMPAKEGGVAIEAQQGNDTAPKIGHYLPKVGDFGLAKMLEPTPSQEETARGTMRSPELTATGAIMGTPSYMAPEQACGNVKGIAAQTDVYALGAVLYELLTGRPPFRAASTMDTLKQVIDAEPVPPSQLNAKTPPDLETICLMCLRKEPAKRYPSAEALAADLARFLRGEPVHARAVTRTERAWRWCRRNPLVASLVTAVAAALVLGTVVALSLAGWALTEARRADRKASDAEESEKRANKEANDARQATELANSKTQEAENAGKREKARADEAIANLASANFLRARSAQERGELDLARDLVETIPTNLRRFEHHFLERQIEGGIFTLHGHTEYVSSVALSPDGALLATGSDDRTARLWDARTGRPLKELKGHAGAVGSVVFSPDGKRLATSARDKKLRLWDVRTGELLLELDQRGCDAFSPDGTHMAGSGRLWNARTGDVVLELKNYGGGSMAISPDGTRLATLGGSPQVCDARTGNALFALKGSTGRIESVAFSPDGTRLVTGGEMPWIWDALTGNSIVELKGHTNEVRGVAFSPDGSRVATASADKTVRLWDARTGAVLLVLKGHAHIVTSVAFSSDGATLASASYDCTARLWDVRSDVPSLEIKAGQDETLAQAAFSSDGTRIVTGGGRMARLWDARTGAPVAEFKGNPDGPTAVALSRDGARLAACGPDKTVRLWDLKSDAAPLELKGHAQPVTCVAFHSEGDRVATGSFDKTARVWNARTGELVRELKGHRDIVTSVAFSPDAARVVTGSVDKTARVWDVQTGDVRFELKLHTYPVISVAFNHDGSLLATASQDTTAWLWDGMTGAPRLQFKGHSAPLTSVAFSPDGSLLATGSADQTARLWDTRSGVALLELKGGNTVAGVAFSPDGSRLATASYEKVQVRNGRPSARLVELKGHGRNVASLAFSPDSKRVATASADSTARVWDVNTGASQFMLAGHADEVLAVAFSTDGKLLATGSKDNSVRLWNTQTGEMLHELKGHTSMVTTLLFNPDNTLLVSGSHDKTARVWNVRTGKSQHELLGHTREVVCLAFNANGTRLATGSYDRSPRLWDMTTGASLVVLKGNDGLWAVAFSPDGTRLAGQYDDARIVWDLRTGNVIADKQSQSWFADRTRSPDGRWTAVVLEDRVRLVDRDTHPDDLELDARRWDTSFDAYWHAEQMQSRRGIADWWGALFHVNQVLAHQPADEVMLNHRRDILMEWLQSAPKNADALAASTVLALDAGKIDDFRASCGKLAGVAGDFRDQVVTRRLATACILAPQALGNLQPVLDAFRRNMSDKHPEDLRILGGLLLRAGKADEAIKSLEAARKLRDDTVYEDLLLALAYRQLATVSGDPLQAKEAKACLDRAVLSESYERVVGWQGKIELQALRREAVQALAK